MCGITGCLALADGAGPDTEWVGRAAMRLAHRGPDDEAFFADQHLALGFRRLAIIDTPIYGFSENAEEFKAKLVAPVVFPKRMGRADEFAHLVRSLIENDYMNAEVVRFDGGIRFQPK